MGRGFGSHLLFYWRKRTACKNLGLTIIKEIFNKNESVNYYKKKIQIAAE